MARSSVQSFDDPDQLGAALRSGDGKYYLVGRGAFHAELTAVELDHLTLQRGRERLARVGYHGMRPKKVGILGWLDDTSLPIIRGTQMRPGEFMSHGRDMESYHRTSGRVDYVGLMLDADALTRTAIDLTGRELSLFSGEVLRPLSAAASRLLSLAAAACGVAQTAPHVFESREAAHGLEQSLSYALITCLVECTSRREPAPHVRRAATMARFETIVEAHTDRALYVPELCSLLGVPERTLRKCCHQHLGMGPHQYLLQRRMHLARRALLRADPHSETVTSIAMHYGFWELGRFASAYRSMFGEVPSDTLRRAA